MNMALTKESLTVGADDSLRENKTSLFNSDSRRMCPVLQVVLKGLKTGFADQPFDIYREQLSSQYHGLALWEPNPVETLFRDPHRISIGDVGFLQNGTFMRLFNVKLPGDHPSNMYFGVPVGYEPIKRERFNNVRCSKVRQGEYHSHVSKVDNYVRDNTHDVV